MEIPKDIIEGALSQSFNSEFHAELNTVLVALKKSTAKDILNTEKEEENRNEHNKIYAIINQALYSTRLENDKKIELSQIIYTGRYYLQNAISNGNIKETLIFLSINCYLKFKLTDFLTEKVLEKSNTIVLSESILKFLSSIKFETLPVNNAPYYEGKMLQESAEAFTKEDIKNAYNLIEAIDRSGRGFHLNYLLENLIVFQYQLNYTYFLKAMTALSSLHSFVFYLQSLEEEKLIQLANELTLTNKWLNFELIRQILKKGRKEDFGQIEIIAIENALIKIHLGNFNYFKQTVIYFHSSSLFNAALGKLLASLPESEIKEVMIECFTIDAYEIHFKARDFLLEYFTNNASEEKIKYILEIVFKRWESFFKEITATQDFYQNHLLYTDFANYIVLYYSKLSEDFPIIEDITDLINKIRYIDTEWAASANNQITKYHLYYSRLYLLSHAYKNKNLDSIDIRASFSELKKYGFQLQRYYLRTSSNPIEQIGKNFKI